MQRSPQLHALFYNVLFAVMDDGRVNADVGAGLCTGGDNLLKGTEEDVSAIRIAAGVLFYCTDVEGSCPDDLCPACCNGKDVCVPERHV